jgi:hypothetical protein
MGVGSVQSNSVVIQSGKELQTTTAEPPQSNVAVLSIPLLRDEESRPFSLVHRSQNEGGNVSSLHKVKYI